jgi:hypothetical protein
VTPGKLALVLAVVTAALAGALARPVAADAATPCWKALLTDWYDGRIDDTYPLHCYEDALHHLPPDVRTYSSARDDIMRALQSAQTRLARSGTKVGPNTEIPPAKTGAKTSSSPTTTTAPTTSLPGRKRQGGLTGVADRLNPSSPSSVPLPLLVLGALALVLVAAGAAGLLVKRFQGRR